MENLKIYIGQDKTLQAETLDCFKALGYKWHGTQDYIERRKFDAIYADHEGIKVDSAISLSMFNQLNIEYRAVNIEELRDMVVLKRNDVNDANHTDKRDEKIYLTSDNVIYYWQGEWCKSAINKSNDYENYLKNSIKPIHKPQPAPEPAPLQEEYLNTKTGELLCWDKGQPRSPNWIKVPEGAEVYMSGFYGRFSAFYKDNFTLGFSPNDSAWWKCTASLDYLKSNGGKIVWQRNPSEYLDPSDWSLKTVFADQDTISGDWIKVPEGADDLVMFNDGSGFFWKYGKRENGALCCYYIGVGPGNSMLIPEWEEISQTAHAYVGDFGGAAFPKLVWQRNLQPEKQRLNDIAKTAEEHRQKGLRAVPLDPSNPHSAYVMLDDSDITDQINALCDDFGCLPGMDRLTWLREQLQKAATKEQLYQYSASINTPRGTMHYDGLIAVPGRITSIEDYHKVRAEIAKDGNTTPDKVNVHSLNIVG